MVNYWYPNDETHNGRLWEKKEETLMKMKRWISCTLVLIMILALAGCGKKEGGTSPDTGSTTGSEVVIKYPTFQVGSNTAAPVVAKLVEDFNAEYAGKYRIEVEEVPGDADYAGKIKVMISNGELPP